MIDEKKIQKAMKNLDLTREEAIEMLQEDEEIEKHDANPHPLTPEQEKVAKKMRSSTRGPTVYKLDKRERKPNELKREIMQTLFECVQGTDWAAPTLSNPERTIDFTIGDRTFTVSLTEHRKPKEQ